jgi:hypothetical protein
MRQRDRVAFRILFSGKAIACENMVGIGRLH